MTAPRNEPTKEQRDGQLEEQMVSRSPRSLALRLIKAVIGMVVIVGLYLTAQNAIGQWQQEQTRFEAEVAAIDAQLQVESDPQKQQELLESRQSLGRQMPRMRNLRWDMIGVASLLYGLGLVPPGLLLRSAVQALGQSVSAGTAVAAQLLGHAGKYVPGKAMVIILRAGAMSREGVTPLNATVSVFLETFLMMAVGSAVAAAVVIWLPVPRWVGALSFAAALLASLPTLPPILRIVSKRVSRSEDLLRQSHINWRLFFAGWGWSLLSWLLIGASFAALISAIPSATPLPPPLQLFAIATAAISLGVVAGFASLIPGGAGVRELVLTSILGATTGPVHGLLAAILARVVFLAVESILAAGAWWWLRLRSPAA